MEHDAGHLHLVVKVTGDCAGDLDFSVEQSFEGAFIVAIDDRLYRAAINEHAKVSVALRRWVVGLEVGGLDHGAHGDQLAIGVSTDHLLEAGLQGFGQRMATEKRDFVAYYKGPKAFPHGSAHLDAISWSKLQVCGGKNKDRIVAILDKEVIIGPPEVGDGGFEGGRRMLGGVLVRDGGCGVQRNRGRRRR